MAKIYNNKNSNLNEYTRYKKRAEIGALVTVALLFSLLIVFIVYYPLMFLVVPLVIVSGVVTSTMWTKVNILKVGIDGETYTSDIIATLPDSYCGIKNLNIKYDGKTSELDIVVVGPSGVFVVETKNLNGSIIGDCNGPNWTQHKVGRGGTPYSKDFYSPIKQVATHTYRLANFLRVNGISVYVENAVFFANPQTTVQLTGVSTKTPVFTAATSNGQELLNCIANRGTCLSPGQVNKIVNLLLSTM